MKYLWNLLMLFMLLSLPVSTYASGAGDAIENAWKDATDWVEDAFNDVIDAGKDVVAWFNKTGQDINDFADELALYEKLIAEAFETGTTKSGSRAYTAPTGLSAESGSFNITTFNVHGFPEAIKGVSSSQMKRLSSLVQNWSLDIVAFQEDWVTHEELISNLSTNTYPYRTNHFNGSATGFGDGLATISRFPFDANAAIRQQFVKCKGTLWEFIMGETSSPDCQTEKGFSMVRLTVEGDLEIDVYNLHQNTGGDYNTNSPNLKQVSHYIKSNSAGRVVLIAGDWNAYPTDSWMQELMANAGVSFACLDIANASCSIDMVAYRGNEQFTLTPVARETLDDQGISDHRPRKIIFNWTRNPIVAASTASVTEAWKNTSGFRAGCTDAVVLGHISTFAGSDPSVLRMQTSGRQCRVAVQEDQSFDSEVAHASETIDVLVLNKGILHNGKIETGSVQTDHNGTIVTLNSRFSHPVVFAQIATYNGGQQTFAKVTDVTSSSFKVNTAEFEYLDGSHAVETINYVVVEAGTYTLESGKKLIAGTQSVSTTFDGSPNVTTIGAGASNYQLFTQVQSSNSAQKVTTRAAKSSSSFTVSLMVQESSRNAGNTIQGTVGYLVIGQ